MIKEILFKRKFFAVLLGVAVFFVSSISVFAGETTLAGIKYSVYKNGETRQYGVMDPSFETVKVEIPENVGTKPYAPDPKKLGAIIIPHGNGKIKIGLNDKREVVSITDTTNGKVYNAQSKSPVIDSVEGKLTLEAFAKESGYTGDIYAAVKIAGNNFYYDRLIDRIQSGEGPTDTFFNAYKDAVMKDNVLTETQKSSIISALKGDIKWTTDLAQKFKSAIEQNLSSFQAAFFWSDAAQEIQLAFLKGLSDGDKARALNLINQLKQGKTYSDLPKADRDFLRNTVGMQVGTDGQGNTTLIDSVQTAAEIEASVKAANDPFDKTTEGMCPLWDGTFGDRAATAAQAGVAGFFGIFACLKQLLYAILVLISLLVAFIGWVFNNIFTYTVTNMAALVGNAGVVAGGWIVIRDIANISFIFILLYLAISTILQLDEHGVKHGLSRLIVAALLVNFSLFFVKTVVDFSNRLATEIYNQILTSETGEEQGLGSAVIGLFNFQTIFGTEAGFFQDSTNANFSSDRARAFAAGNNAFTVFIMGIIMMTIIIFVFIAATIIFIKRMVILLLLMVFSPLAFAGMAIPNHGIQHEVQHKFWSTLLKEAFYAPVFFMIILLGLAIANSSEFKGLVAGAGVADGEFSILSFGTIVSYCVVIYTFIAALIAAEEIGVQGASGAMTVFTTMRDKTADWVHGNTISRAASTLINKTDAGDDLRDMASGLRGKKWYTKWGFQTFGRAVTGTADKLGGTFDNWSAEQQKWMKDAISNRHNDFGLRAKQWAQGATEGTSSVRRKAMDDDGHHLSAEEHAEMIKRLTDLMNSQKDEDQPYRAGAKAALFRMYEQGGHGRLDADKAVEVQKVLREKILPYDREKFSHDAFNRDSKTGKISGISTEERLTKALNQFRMMSDKQKADLVSNLSPEEQNALADSEEFSKSLMVDVHDFDMLEKIRKGPAVSKKMKGLLSKIAYSAKGRQELYESMEKAPEDTEVRELFQREVEPFFYDKAKVNLRSILIDKNNTSLQEEFKEQLEMIGMRTDKDINDLIKDYETMIKDRKQSLETITKWYATDRLNSDITFGKNAADKNLNRLTQMTDEYKKIHEVTGKYVDEKKGGDKDKDKDKNKPVGPLIEVANSRTDLGQFRRNRDNR